MAVELKITTDEADVIKAWHKLQRELEKTKDQLRSLRQESKKGADEFSLSVKDNVTSLAQMVTGVSSLQDILGKGLEMYGQWREEMRQAGVEQSKLNKLIAEGIAKSGDFKEGKKISTALGGIKGITTEQANEIFRGVTGAAPTQPLERRLQFVREAAKMAPIESNLGGMGQTAGALMELAPGKSADDILDLTKALEAKAGENAGALTDPSFLRTVAKLKSTGVLSEEGSLGFGLAALQQNLKPELLQQIGAAVDSAPSQHRGRLSPEQRLQNQFGKLGPQERFQALMANPDMARAILGDQPALSLKQLPQEMVAARGAELVAAQRDNFATQMVGESLGFPEGQSAMRQQMATEAEEEATKAAKYWAARKGETRSFVAGHFGFDPISRGLYGMTPSGSERPTFEAEEISGYVKSQLIKPEEAVKFLGATANPEEQLNQLENYLEKNKRATGGGGALRMGQGEVNPQMQAILDLVREARRTNQLLERRGQKNINAHTEN